MSVLLSITRCVLFHSGAQLLAYYSTHKRAMNLNEVNIFFEVSITLNYQVVPAERFPI